MSTSRIGRSVNNARYYLHCRRQHPSGPVPKDDRVTRRARRSEQRAAQRIVDEELDGLVEEAVNDFCGDTPTYLDRHAASCTDRYCCGCQADDDEDR